MNTSAMHLTGSIMYDLTTTQHSAAPRTILSELTTWQHCLHPYSHSPSVSTNPNSSQAGSRSHGLGLGKINKSRKNISLSDLDSDDHPAIIWACNHMIMNLALTTLWMKNETMSERLQWMNISKKS
jgi:hypothetical protein